MLLTMWTLQERIWKLDNWICASVLWFNENIEVVVGSVEDQDTYKRSWWS